MTHGLQPTRLSCPSPYPRACRNLCPSSQWHHPTISSSAIPFSSCLQSFTASGSFPVSFLFASGGQSIGASASASVLSVNIQGWFPLGLTGLISLLSKGFLRVFTSITAQNIKFSVFSLLYGPTLTSIHDYWKAQSFDYNEPLSAKWCLCFLICCLGWSLASLLAQLVSNLPAKQKTPVRFLGGEDPLEKG